MSNYGTRQNNDKSAQANVNTKGVQFMNRDGFDPSTLTVRGWNEMLSFTINPALEPSKQTDNRIFDYERFVATSLTLEKAYVLLYKIEKVIIPAIEADEDKSVGIPVGGDSLLVVGTGKRITGSIRPYLSIHKSLNPNTKKPEQSLFYEFANMATIDNYNEESGEFETSPSIRSEFEVFVRMLKSFIMFGGNFGAHSNRVVEKYWKDKIMNLANSIAEKLGISTGNRYSGNSYGSRENVFGSGQSSTKNSGADLESESINGLEDLNDMING